MSGKRRTVWLERALAMTAFVCLSWVGYVTLDATFFQREQAAAFEQLRAVPIPPNGMTASTPEPDEQLVGILDVPRLAFSTPVIVGDDESTLQVAAGLLPDTPKPWEPGNSAIAGHRDGLFRPLKNVRIGDEVVVRTTHGDLRYRVRETKIVMPDDLTVLEQTATHTLTLITCYPFNYIGSAPKRFVVHADRIVSGDHPRPAVARSKEAGTMSRISPKGSKSLWEPRPERGRTSRTSAESQKGRKSLARTSAHVRKEPKFGSRQNLFKKIASFFKKPKAPHDIPERSTARR